MSIDAIKKRIPDYAKDLRLNLGNVFNTEDAAGLDEKQLLALGLATAIASRNPELIRAMEGEARGKLDETWLNATNAAAAIMGMNNVYYRFVHLASNEEYGKLPAKLRMNVIGNPGIDKADFELLSLAVSAINGCGLCIDSHEKVLKQAGVSALVVQHAVRIASVMHAPPAGPFFPEPIRGLEYMEPQIRADKKQVVHRFHRFCFTKRTHWRR